MQGLRKITSPEKFIINADESRLSSGLLINFGSIIILAAAGIILNILLVSQYSSLHVGLFVQAITVYFIVSQLSVAGVSFSVLHFVAVNRKDEAVLNELLSSAVFIVATISAFFMVTMYFLSAPVALLFDSEHLVFAIYCIIPGVLFFALNKVIFAYLNSFNLMKRFALFSSLRYIFLVLTLFFFAIKNFEAIFLSSIFSISEFLLFIVILIDYMYVQKRGFSFPTSEWMSRHIRFGLKGFFNGVLWDANSKIDVIMLAVLMSDSQVGAYGIASMFSEGIFQLSIAVQNVFNPLIASYYKDEEFEKLKILSRKTLIYFMPLMCIVGVTACMLYPLIIDFFSKDQAFLESNNYFYILVLGVSLSSFGYPFFMTLTQCGYPGWQSILIIFMVVSNILFNSIFISLYGVVGAAIGTSISMLLSMVFLRIIVNHKLGFRLL